MTSRGPLVRVAIAVPLADAFDYVWPHAGPAPAPGVRVRVPFGRRERVGIVIEHPAESPLEAAKLKSIHAALDEQPIVGSELLHTLRWAADYYHYPVGEVLSHALPAGLREGRPLDAPGERAWRISAAAGPDPLTNVARTAKKQAEALAAIGAAGSLTDSQLRTAGIGADTLRRLAAKNLVELAPAAAPAAAASGTALPEQAAPPLTADQSTVLAAIEENEPSGFRAFLLHGVTGSGKTEVYLRLIAARLAAGRQTLLLVPEIGLTPQLVARLTSRFGAQLAVLHSGLTESERLDAWRRAHRAEAKLVVGTRSAVFAPLPAAGLIVVDEEHDSSYKQQSGFRYSARDLAVVRARRLDVPVLLASATPSLESFQNAQVGRYSLLSMPRRIGSAGQPLLRVIDLNRHPSRQALSTPLVAAIGQHLRAGNQVMLFLNRRGFAPALFCPECKQLETCGRCDARLTVHARAAVLRCHHCGHERALHWRCGACGGERIAVGAGTQRVDDELHQLFPDARIARLDRDATSRKGALAATLREVEEGGVDILVGTQMLTKGHDFPRVTLVGVLSADQGLFGTDPRSHERLAQTLLQVAGRAGRAELPGEVLIQTYYPEHPLLKCLLEQDYAAFAALALEDRSAAEWPPFAHLAAWRAEAAQREAVFAFLNRVKALAGPAGTAGVAVLGPAAAVMERKEGRYRAQLLLRSPQRQPLHEAVARILSAARGWPEARKVRWSLDVDPLEI